MLRAIPGVLGLRFYRGSTLFPRPRHNPASRAPCQKQDPDVALPTNARTEIRSKAGRFLIRIVRIRQSDSVGDESGFFGVAVASASV
jgi:hypothetical protein